MALRSLQGHIVAFGILLFLVTPRAISSCGPFLESAIFAFKDRPDGPAERTSRRVNSALSGQASAQTTWLWRTDIFSGLKLTDQQQKAALDVWKLAASSPRNRSRCINAPLPAGARLAVRFPIFHPRPQFRPMPWSQKTNHIFSI